MTNFYQATMGRFFAFSAVLLSSLLPLQSTASDVQIEQLAEPIILAIEKGRVSKLSTLAFSSSETGKYFSEADLSLYDGRLEASLAPLGEFRSSLVLFESRIPDSWVSRWYLLKYDRQPILLYLAFYKAKDDWRIQEISLDSDLDEYIEDAAKVGIGSMPGGTINGLLHMPVDDAAKENGQ